MPRHAIERPRSVAAAIRVFDRRERAFAAAALAFATLCLLWRLAAEPIDHGYVRYLGLAAEMLRTGDWLVPRLGDWVYLHKPPLFLWLIAAAGRWLGPDCGLVPHAPNLLALGLSAWWMTRLGERLFGRRDAAFAATLVYLTSFETFSLLRDKRIDPLFAAFLLGAFERFHAAWCAHRAGGRALAPMALSGLWLALATLVKGPLAAGFFLAVAVPFCLATGSGRLLLGAPGALALGVFVAAAGLWPVLLVERLGLDETRRLLGATRLTTRKGGLFHYLVNLPGQLAPWTLLLPSLVAAAWTRRRTAAGAPPGLRFAAIGFVAIFLLLHASPMKHSRYLLPAFAPLSLLVVALFASIAAPGPAALDPTARRLRDGALRLGFVLFGVAGLGAVVAAPFLPEGGVPAGLAGMLCAGGAWLGWRRLAPSEAPEADRVPALLLLALLAAVAFGAYDGGRAERLAARSTLPAARDTLAPVRDGAPSLLVGLGESPTILVQILAGRALDAVPSPAAAAAWVHAEGAGGAESVLLVAPLPLAAKLIAEPGFTVRSTAPLTLAGHAFVRLEASPMPSPPPRAGGAVR